MDTSTSAPRAPHAPLLVYINIRTLVIHAARYPHTARYPHMAHISTHGTLSTHGTHIHTRRAIHTRHAYSLTGSSSVTLDMSLVERASSLDLDPGTWIHLDGWIWIQVFIWWIQVVSSLDLDPDAWRPQSGDDGSSVTMGVLCTGMLPPVPAATVTDDMVGTMPTLEVSSSGGGKGGKPQEVKLGSCPHEWWAPGGAVSQGCQSSCGPPVHSSQHVSSHHITSLTSRPRHIASHHSRRITSHHTIHMSISPTPFHTTCPYSSHHTYAPVGTSYRTRSSHHITHHINSNQ